MLKLIGQRLGLGLLTLLAASALIFIGTELLPGDLASAILQNPATPENLAKLRLDLGLDRPAIVRYAEWLFGALRGDFGHSLANGRDVLTRDRAALRQHDVPRRLRGARRDAARASGSGSIAAIRQGGLFDRLINLLTLMTISVPDYFLAYLLIIFVAVDLGWFPSLANVTPDTPFFERLYVAFLPMVTLGHERARAHDAHDARLGARGDGEPLYRDVDPEGPDARRASWCATRCRTRLRRSSR